MRLHWLSWIVLYEVTQKGFLFRRFNQFKETHGDTISMVKLKYCICVCECVCVLLSTHQCTFQYGERFCSMKTNRIPSETTQ